MSKVTYKYILLETNIVTLKLLTWQIADETRSESQFLSKNMKLNLSLNIFQVYGIITYGPVVKAWKILYHDLLDQFRITDKQTWLSR